MPLSRIAQLLNECKSWKKKMSSGLKIQSPLFVISLVKTILYEKINKFHAVVCASMIGVKKKKNRLKRTSFRWFVRKAEARKWRNDNFESEACFHAKIEAEAARIT